MKGSVVKQKNEMLELDINEGDTKYVVKLNQRGRDGMSRVKVAFNNQGTKNKVHTSKNLKGKEIWTPLRANLSHNNISSIAVSI